MESKDLRWSEHKTKSLLLLSLPIAVSMLSYALKTITDTYFVGQIGDGDTELAAVALGGVIAFTPIAFGIGLLRSVKVLGAQAVGAEDYETPRKYLGTAIWVALWAGLFMAGILSLVAVVTPSLAPNPVSGIYAREYVVIRGLSAVFIFLFCAVREYSYALDDAATPMVASLLANFANVALDYLFVIHFGWGVAGAAWATALAVVVECVVVALAKYRHLSFNRDWQRAKRLIKVGLPMGLQFSLEVTAFTMIAVLLALVSTRDVAAHHIVLQIEHLSFLPAFAVGEAASILVGQAIGARRNDLVFAVAKRAFLVALLYTAVCTVVFVWFAEPIVTIFAQRSGAELVELSKLVLYIGCSWLAIDSVQIVGRSVLRGVGDVRFVARWGIICVWGITIVSTLVLGVLLGYGVVGAWVGLTIEVAIAAGIFLYRFYGKAWEAVAEQSRRDAIT